MQDNPEKISSLLNIMAKLRDPESGCPWDVKQTYQSIVPYTIEETYEVVDAIERDDFDELKSELGDLLFQVVFYCQIAREEGHFEFNDVIDSICDKLVRRHPHVFSDKTFESEDELHRAWEASKHQERQNKVESASFMDDVPLSLPALKRAQKLQKRAAKQGFDWPDVEGVWAKIEEEIIEIKHEELTGNQERLEDEVGDLLFAVVNLARHYKLDAESILRKATQKFENRFRVMEQHITESNLELNQLNLEQMEAYWQMAKRVLSDISNSD